MVSSSGAVHSHHVPPSIGSPKGPSNSAESASKALPQSNKPTCAWVMSTSSGTMSPSVSMGSAPFKVGRLKVQMMEAP